MAAVLHLFHVNSDFKSQSGIDVTKKGDIGGGGGEPSAVNKAGCQQSQVLDHKLGKLDAHGDSSDSYI